MTFHQDARLSDPSHDVYDPHVGHGASPMAAGSFSVGYDERAGQVRIIGKGCWDVAMARRHSTVLAATLARVRASGAPVRALVDLRESGVQVAAVNDCIRDWTGRLYAAGDRVAIVVASSVLKATMRNVAAKATRETFLSRSAAETWLMAYA